MRRKRNFALEIVTQATLPHFNPQFPSTGHMGTFRPDCGEICYLIMEICWPDHRRDFAKTPTLSHESNGGAARETPNLS